MSGIDPTFWRRRRVLVTGHTGFKGSWLTLLLDRLGAEVAGFALAPATSPSLYAEAQVDDRVSSTIGDVRDATALATALARDAPEVVVHLAAQPLVPASYDDPAGTFAVNVLGTVNLLEAVRATPSVRVVVVVTSDKCYESREWPWPYRESDRLGGADPYSASKACAELVVESYRRSFLPGGDPAAAVVATARSGNTIGGGDWTEGRIVPDTIRAILTGKELVLRHPGSVRPWQHVLDVLSGYLQLAQALWADPTLPGAWNFAPDPGEACTVEQLVERLAARLRRPVRWAAHAGSLPHETAQLRLDASLARHALGWRPRLSLDESLAAIASWHDGHAAGRPAAELVSAELDRLGPPA